ncbi:hypothetical protein FRC07_007228 [Ceratobasidium sp. 392]|nr:hypothetical protein FRC07_007228 [Ceratobasidium sp. 392]
MPKLQCLLLPTEDVAIVATFRATPSVAQLATILFLLAAWNASQPLFAGSEEVVTDATLTFASFEVDWDCTWVNVEVLEQIIHYISQMRDEDDMDVDAAPTQIQRLITELEDLRLEGTN